MMPNKSNTTATEVYKDSEPLNSSLGSNTDEPRRGEEVGKSESNESKEASKTTQTNKRIGRPRKKKNPVGRPKGEGAIMKEYRQRMLNSPKSRKVLDSILNAALDDEHKHQAAAWKIVADRILPVSSFEVDSKNSKPSVNITITGIGEKSRVNIDDGPIDDADYEEVDLPKGEDDE